MRLEGSPIIQFMWKESHKAMGLLIVQLHKFLGTKRKNKELLRYYQEHLQAQVEANKALEQGNYGSGF